MAEAQAWTASEFLYHVGAGLVALAIGTASKTLWAKLTAHGRRLRWWWR